MPKFFCEEKIGDQLIVRGEDARHIGRVLRMKIGESLCVGGNDGYDYQTKIISIQDQEVVLSVLDKKQNDSEPNVRITLYQALPKGDKFDFITQKAVELGVSEIVPVLTKRCVSRPDEKSVQKKRERWQKIAREAAKQSGRGIIPKVMPMVSFSDALKQLESKECALLCYEGGGSRLNQLVSKQTREIGIMIGSEGGFEQEEVALAKQMEISVATLGKLILRCETAPLAAVSILMNITENI